jgi:predicted dehydrogenase
MSSEGGFTSMAASGGSGEAPAIGIGMLGYAFMGKAHANGYKKLGYMTWPPPMMPELVAIAGRNEAAVAEAARRYGFAEHVTDWRQLIADERIGLFDNAGPNNLHAEPTVAAAEAGKHVICEKPLGRDAAESFDTWQRVAATGVKHMCAFNYRFVPAVRLARELIEAGELGALVRVQCIEPWFRTAAYYRSAGWRGTWGGEGGGVLLNQAPHTLDLLCHLAGPPARVWGWTRTRAHAIEVEDSAQALLEFSNGAPGYLHVSTVEAGSRRRIQIVGDRAALDLDGDQLTIARFAQPLSEFRSSSPELFAAPTAATEIVELPPGDGGGHLAVYQDLQAAILEGRRPQIDGREGRMSLELANAIVLSSHTERPVQLPLDRTAYSALLAELRGGAR